MLLRNSIYGLLIKVAGAALAFLSSVLIAKGLGAVQSGYYFYLISLLGVTTSLSVFGGQTYILKAVPNFFLTGRTDEAASIVAGAFIRTFVIWLVILGLTTIAIFSGYQFLPSIITGNPALIYVGLAGPLLALNVILSHSVQAQGQVILAFVTSGLSHSAVFIILFVLFDPANARDLAFYYLIATLVVTLHLILQNYRFLKRVDQSSAIGYASPGRSAQFFVVQIGLELSVQSPVLLLGLLQHSSAEIAGYAIASRAALILSFVYAVTNRIVMPQFSQHYAQKSWLELKKDFSRSIMIMSTIAVPIAIAILILSKDLLAFFGGEFKRFSVALWILVLGQTIHVLTGPAGNLLLMADRHVLFRNLVFVGLILTVLVNIALIPELGAVGAAIALLVGYGFINISSLVFAWRLLRDLEHE